MQFHAIEKMIEMEIDYFLLSLERLERRVEELEIGNGITVSV